MRQLKFDRTRPVRFAIYARQSCNAPNPRSPEQQAVTIREEIKRQGLTWVEAGCYQDAGIAGHVFSKRPGFVVMAEEIRSGCLQVEVILVETSERLCRLDDISGTVSAGG